MKFIELFIRVYKEELNEAFFYKNLFQFLWLRRFVSHMFIRKSSKED